MFNILMLMHRVAETKLLMYKVQSAYLLSLIAVKKKQSLNGGANNLVCSKMILDWHLYLYWSVNMMYKLAAIYLHCGSNLVLLSDEKSAENFGHAD